MGYDGALMVVEKRVNLIQSMHSKTKYLYVRPILVFIIVTLLIWAISTLECEKPTGCGAGYDVYTQVDCDEDGILDHACHTTINDNRWLVLSSEGCLNNWGSSARSISECQAAWVKEGILSLVSSSKK